MVYETGHFFVVEKLKNNQNVIPERPAQGEYRCLYSEWNICSGGLSFYTRVKYGLNY